MSKGKKICLAIAAYMVIKSIVNLILGFSVNNLFWLVVFVLFGYFLYEGRPYFNLITAAVLALLFLLNLKTNITGHYWFYLGEGIADVVCAALLVINKDVKSCFDNKLHKGEDEDGKL
ncbi:MAG: hypothetical protein LUE12_09770 [Ruminococcus sp.]|nr:hypothetical protein [Ruminococcus sp.]